MVGASSDPTKFSYGVLRVLHEQGYNMKPVNPFEAGKEIRGLKVYDSIASIDEPVDMVQVFRASRELPASRARPLMLARKFFGGKLEFITRRPRSWLKRQGFV